MISKVSTSYIKENKHTVYRESNAGFLRIIMKKVLF